MYSFTPTPLTRVIKLEKRFRSVAMLTERKCVIAYECVELNRFSTGEIFFRATFFLFRHHLHVKIDAKPMSTNEESFVRAKKIASGKQFTTDINDMMISVLSPWFVQNAALLSHVQQCLTMQETNSSVSLPTIHTFVIHNENYSY